MAITDSQKLDFLWKKIGFGAAKTDTNAAKKAPNEAISSPLILRGDIIWEQANQIPAVIPTSNSVYVGVYSDSLSTTIETTEDNTSTTRRTWKTGLTNWIPTEFGSTYQVKVYVDNTGESAPQSTGTQLFATGSGNNDEWYYDYSAGILHFIGTNLPSGVTAGKSIYVVGARYIGRLGLGSASEVGVTFDNTLSSANGAMFVYDSVNNEFVQKTLFKFDPTMNAYRLDGGEDGF
jgi:hypothetical protein